MSKACTLLFKLFMDETSGVHHMGKEQLWKSHKAFQEYPLKDFEKYVDGMVDRTNARRKLVQEEEEAYNVYVITDPRREVTDRNIPYWDTHAADNFLGKDLED